MSEKTRAELKEQIKIMNHNYQVIRGMHERGYQYSVGEIKRLQDELERTRKALDAAVKAMESAKYFRLEHCMCCGHDPQKDEVYIKLKKALDKITALEQKE